MSSPIARKSILPEDPDVCCGYGPFKLALDHPFTSCCAGHDTMYNTHMWMGKEVTRKFADEWFFKCMKRTAHDLAIPQLKMQARIFYVIVKTLGWLFW